MASLVWLVQGVLALLGAAAVAAPILGHRSRRRQEERVLEPAFPDRAPPSSVVIPIKGRHQGLHDNLAAFLDQDHPDLDVIFVVDELDDPATPTIEEVLAEHDEASDDTSVRASDVPVDDAPPGGDGPAHPGPAATTAVRSDGPDARLLSVADHGPDAGSFRIGKARAHATALENLRSETETVIFADADARPRPDWARRMVAPLTEPGGDRGPDAASPGSEDEPEPSRSRDGRPVGAVTTYRWYVSERHGFWSRIRAQWNATGHDAMVDPERRFCWGGSMATRRDLIDELDVVERMRGALADDVALTDAVRDAGLRIVYEPRAACLNVEDCDREACLEWCVRQTTITRATMPDLWRRSFASYAVGVGSFVLGCVLLGASAMLGMPLVALSGLGLMAPVLFEPIRSRRRWRFFHRVLAEDGERLEDEPDLVSLAWAQPFFMLYLLWRSARTDAIRWRGRTYPVDADRPETEVG